MSHVKVDADKCKYCGYCAFVCPCGVFDNTGKIVDPVKCNNCRLCEAICPDRAVYFEDYPRLIRPISRHAKLRGGWTTRPAGSGGGRFFASGNELVAQAALDAGCLFYAGYPITPSTEIMYGLMDLNNAKGGCFVQMEDEISSMAAVIGASFAGTKAMTATSGPGLSNMQENIGLAVMTEAPCVIVDVQRAGPSTGQATRPAQADIMAAIWGSHADAPKVVLAPVSVEDCYHTTIEAFNLSEKYRTPVIVLLDELLAHTKQSIRLPKQVRVYNRIYSLCENHFGQPANRNFPVSSLPMFGDGEGLSITGSTHDETGRRQAGSPDAQQNKNDWLGQKMNRIIRDIKGKYSHRIIPDTCVVCTGSVVNSVRAAIVRAWNVGMNVDILALRHLSPFPYGPAKEKLGRKKRILVVEMNQGQLIHMVREVRPDAESLVQNNGLAISPQKIYDHLAAGGE